MEPPLSQIESMVEDHQKEIRRRREGYEEHVRQREEGCEPIGFGQSTGGGGNDPFRDPSQSFVVFNLSHTHIPPRTPDGGDPGLRLCGAFATQEEALHHARGLAAADPDCSVLLTPTHEWAVMASTPEMLADPETIEGLKAERLGAYQRELLRHREDFERRRSQMEEEEDSDEAVEAPAKKARESPPDEEGAAPGEEGAAPGEEGREYLGSFPRTAEIREQAVAVVSFLPDDDAAEAAHTLFCVWRVFSTEAEAESWIVNVAGNHVRDFSFDTVSLYEWLKPQTVHTSDIRKVTYRNKEQSSIMTFASNQKSAIDSFKRECTQKGHETPFIDV